MEPHVNARGPDLTHEQYVTREYVYDLLKAEIRRTWAAAGNKGELPEIGEDDNLFDAGVVDSLTMVELVAYIESISGGEPIDFLAIDPDLFFTLRGACTVLKSRDFGRRPATRPSPAPDA